MRYGVFVHVFNDVSINAYVFLEYFLNNFKNSTINSTKYPEICNTIHVALINTNL